MMSVVRRLGGSYFTDEHVVSFGNEFTSSYWRMTLEEFLGKLLGAGFMLEGVVEPRATEEARRVDPRRYDKTQSTPLFLAVRLRRP